jgi:hypothetical protein
VSRFVQETLDRLQSLSEDDLRRALAAHATNPFFRALALVTGTLLLMLRGVLLLVANWRLILLELIPAVWLAVMLWDLRYHVVAGHALVVPTGGWTAVAVAVIFAATAGSYWCNVAFAFAAVGDGTGVRAATRAANANLGPILSTAAVVAAAHSWVSLRGASIGIGTFGVGLAVVVAINMYLYTALPAQIVGLSRTRRSVRQRVERGVLAATVGALAAAPGFLLSRLGQLLLAFTATRPIGIVVLAVAVLLQVAGVSSSRAVAMSSQLVDETPS